MSDPAPGRFVWPPKPLPRGTGELIPPSPIHEAVPAPAPLPKHVSSGTLDPEESWAGFEVQHVIEPDPATFNAGQENEPWFDYPASIRSPDPEAGFARARPGSMSRWLDALEDCFLGRHIATWGIRAAEGQWRPDEPGEYCRRCGSDCRPPSATMGVPGPGQSGTEPCETCRAMRLPWSRAIRLGRYEGLLADAVRQVKFTRWRSLGTELGRALGTQIAKAMKETGQSPATAAIVPVPMSTLHRWTRGIDHTLVLARAAARVVGCPVVRALGRSYRPSQVAVPTSERRSNVSGAFRLRRRLRGVETIIALDDVRTTGSTMREVCRVIRGGRAGEGNRSSSGGGVEGAVLWIAVVAVTPDKNRP